MSKFSMVQESADTDLEETSPSTPDVNTAGVVEEVMEEFTAMQNADSDVAELSDNYENVGEIKEAVELAQEGCLSPMAAQLLRTSLRNITGRAYAANRLPAMEAFESHRSKHEAYAVALEGIGQTLKDFWTAIKNQITKFWNSTKQWYIKALDGSNKLIARAKALSEKADGVQGTAKERTFPLSGAGLISVNYQTKDANAMIKALDALQATVDGNLVNVSKENGSNKAQKLIDDFSRQMHTARNRATNEAAADGSDAVQQMDNFISLYLKEEGASNPIKPDLTVAVAPTDEVYKQVVGDTTQGWTLLTGEQLPGSRRLYQVAPPKELPAGMTMLDIFKAHRCVLAPLTAKPKEMDDSPEVQTLNNGQISKIADTVGVIGETILKYKKEFEARDRYYNQMLKGLDRITREMEGDFQNTAMESADNAPATPAPVTPAPAPAQQQQQQAPAATPKPADNTVDAAGNKLKQNQAIDKYARKFVSSVSGVFRKEIALSGSLLTHSMKVCSVFLTYGERSVAQYGS